MSDDEEDIEFRPNLDNESCMNTYSGDNNKSQDVKILKLDSISLNDNNTVFK